MGRGDKEGRGGATRARKLHRDQRATQGPERYTGTRELHRAQEPTRAKNLHQDKGQGAAAADPIQTPTRRIPLTLIAAVATTTATQAATHVRGSPDYVPVRNLPYVQWAIGPDVLFHWAGLGLRAYKDTFFSNSQETPKSTTAPFTGYSESASLLHALMATLSGGPVTFSDAVGAANLTLLRAIVRDDGVVLRPSRPVTALDVQMQAMAFGGFPGTLPAGEAALTLAKCDASRKEQRWTARPAANVSDGVVLVADVNKCMDVAKCNHTAGSRVDAFDCLYPQPVGTCDGRCASFVLAHAIWRARAVFFFLMLSLLHPPSSLCSPQPETRSTGARMSPHRALGS